MSYFWVWRKYFNKPVSLGLLSSHPQTSLGCFWGVPQIPQFLYIPEIPQIPWIFQVTKIYLIVDISLIYYISLISCFPYLSYLSYLSDISCLSFLYNLSKVLKSLKSCKYYIFLFISHTAQITQKSLYKNHVVAVIRLSWSCLQVSK